jgi:hypothetical protein
MSGPKCTYLRRSAGNRAQVLKSGDGARGVGKGRGLLSVPTYRVENPYRTLYIKCTRCGPRAIECIIIIYKLEDPSEKTRKAVRPPAAREGVKNYY